MERIKRLSELNPNNRERKSVKRGWGLNQILETHNFYHSYPEFKHQYSGSDFYS